MAQKNNGFLRGCGCVLAILGAIIMACGLIFAIAMYTADKDAGEQNAADWELFTEYQEKIDAKIDSLTAVYGEELPDSLCPKNPIPTPYIRQGGFATMFGVVGAIVCLILGVLPLTVGLILWFVNNRKPLPPPESFKKDI